MRILEVQYWDELPKIIKRWIKMHKITMEELGFRIGVSQQCMSNYLNRRTRIPYEHLIAILKALEIDELVIFMDPPKIKNKEN